MDTIIGLGRAGCAIADKFAEYSQYSVYKLDVGLKKGPSTFPLKEYKNIENYEKNLPNLKQFFKDVGGDILFVVAGGGKVSSASLAVLEYLQNCKINLIYIKPDLSFLGKEQELIERTIFNVFQEYTRSGLFEKMFIISNEMIESIFNGFPIKNYYKKINESVVSTLHMINLFNHVDSISDTFSDPPAGAKISTIGFVDLEKNDDHVFFSLDNVSDIVYYYAYNSKKLEEDNTLFKNIKDSIKDKTKEGVRVTYGIFETDYEQDYIYCVNHSSVIQE